MGISRRKMDSPQLGKSISFLKLMTKSMPFDATMESANWPKLRRRNDFFYKFMPKEDGVTYERKKLGRTDAMMVCPRDNIIDENNIFLYIHGGGFVTGNAFVSKSYTSMLAKYSNNRVYAVQYALAPEYKFPTGFDECCEAFEALMKLYPNSQISLIGESAGGNLSVSLALKYKDTGRIASVTAHSPTTDLSGKLDHTQNENKDFIVKPGCAEPLSRMYVGKMDATSPYISPIYGDFTGFPSTFITCDINETLYADAKALYEKCVEAGVTVEMIEAVGTYHAFAVAGTIAPETTLVLVDNIDFVKKSLKTKK